MLLQDFARYEGTIAGRDVVREGLCREGRKVNAKRIYRLYGLEGLVVRTKPRKKRATRTRVRLPRPTRPNECWSIVFVSARLANGRWFRTPTVVDLTRRPNVRERCCPLSPTSCR